MNNIKTAILLTLVSLLAACGGSGAGDEAPEYFIRATVTMTDGTLVFEAVGYSPGSVIDGTFDNLRLDRDEPDDTVHILAVNGRFHCLVD